MIKNFLNKFKWFILGGTIVLSGTVFAVQVSVPSGNGAGFLLQSLSTGNYGAVSLVAGSNVTISTTTTSITISASGSGGSGGSGNVSTSSVPVIGNLSFWTTTTATPALLGTVGTTTLTASSPLSLSNPVVKVGGSNSVLTIDTSGTWSGNAGTATALAANGTNCSAGDYARGVDASGNAENCTTATTGTVTAVSVASANGFAGSSSGGATPAITLTTSITGVLKGNGTAISAASNGTDYTLITALDCTGSGHLLKVTAAGVFTCGADGGGSGGGAGGTFSTSTISGYTGVLNNYANNATDVVEGGGTAGTSTAKFYFDPNSTQFYQIGNANTASTTIMGKLSLPSLTQGALYIGSAGLTATVATGTVSAGSSAITVTSGRSVFGGLLAIDCAAASGSQNGCLSSTDWTTFNGKISALDNWTHPSAGKSATTTEIQITGGLLSTASTTISSNLFLSSLTQGILTTGTNGLVKAVATSSFSLSQFTNDLASLTAGDTSLTLSGSYNGSVARTVILNTANANTFSALQTFNYSSSTIYSSFINASTTNLFAGNIRLATSTLGCIQAGANGQLYSTGSSCGTSTGLTAYDAWTHPAVGQSATTSNMIFSGALNGFGTTTPMAQVQIATTSANAGFRPQLVLSDIFAPLNTKHWYINSMSGIFDIGTTSDIGTYATSSAFQISAPCTFGSCYGFATTSPTAFMSLDVASSSQGATQSTPFGYLLSMIINGTRYMVNFFDYYGHEFFQGKAAVCDANCTFIAGNDNAFRVILGSGVTSSTVTFAYTWGAIAPICIANEGSAGTVAVEASSTPTTVVLTALSALTSKDVDVICRGIK